MSLLLEDKERKIIPRWRDVRAANAAGELGSLRGVNRSHPETAGSFDEKIGQWQSEPSVANAVDVVGAALVFGREREAMKAADFLLTQELPYAPSVVSSALKVLVNADPDHSKVGEVVSLSDLQTAQGRIHHLKSRLGDDPRNSLAWADLAREYAVVGQLKQSERAMGRALIITPSNRFLLRSAARLYIHLNDPDRAHDLLRRKQSTRRDPWLLSVEISVASIAGRTSHWVKEARSLVEDLSLSPSDTSELSSALATLDLTAGDAKHAKRFFRRSLIMPSENTVAQAGWATRHLAGFDFDLECLKVPRSFEARGWVAFRAEEWREAVVQYRQWLLDQPFSKWPATLGSALASIALGDWEESRKFTVLGLQANPGDPTLLNNQAVALAFLNRVQEAEAVFNSIRRDGCASTTAITLTATEGLLAFRRGLHDRGRQLYRQAIEKADGEKQWGTKALALLMLAREEKLAQMPQFASTLAEAIEVPDIARYRHYAPLIKVLLDQGEPINSSRITLPTHRLSRTPTLNQGIVITKR